MGLDCRLRGSRAWGRPWTRIGWDGVCVVRSCAGPEGQEAHEQAAYVTIRQWLRCRLPRTASMGEDSARLRPKGEKQWEGSRA